MSSPRRSKEPDRYRYNRDNRDGYDDTLNDSSIYPRNYAPWQWGYWASDNMAYNGGEGAYYVEDGRRDRGQGYYVGNVGNVYDNAGFQTYKQGYSGGSYKLKGSSSEGFSEHPGEGPSRPSYRRCIVVLSVVGLVFLIGAGLAIGIYFGIVDKPESRPSDTPTTTLSPPVDLSAALTLKLDQTFSSDLNNPDSDTYKTLEQDVIDEVDRNMKSGPQASAYNGVEVTGFSNGSVVVFMFIFFKDSTYRKNNADIAITPANIQSELQTQLQTSTANLIQVDSIQVLISQVTGKARLGDICSSPNDCAVANSVCTGLSSSICQCVTGYYDSNGAIKNGVCLPKKLNDEACDTSAVCGTANAVCQSGVCTCAGNRYFNQDSNSCDTKLQQGESGCVDATLQCALPGAVCQSGWCACAVGYQVKNNACTKLIDYEESGCDLDTDCSTPNAVCAARVCRCVSGDFYDSVAQSCQPKVEYGQACNGRAVDECKTIDANCDQATKTCICSDTQYRNGDRCSDKIGDGESCTSADSCSYGEAVCLSNFCTCDVDRYVNNDAKSCDLKVLYDAPCKGSAADHWYDNQCLTDGAQCNTATSTCRCMDGYYLDGTKCSPKVAYNAACKGSFEDECVTPNAECDPITLTCKCIGTKYLNVDKCSEKTGTGQACTVDEGCSFKHAKCLSGFCACESDRFVNNGASSCDLKVEYDGICKGGFADECETTEAVCNSDTKKCLCPAGMYLNGNRCSNKVAFDDVCIGGSEDECLTPKAKCHDTEKKCLCIDTQYLEGNTCVDKIAYNQVCQGNAEDECLTPDAVCDDGTNKCVCPVEMFLNANVCSDKVAYKGPCEGNNVEECVTPDATCDMTAKQCLCIVGYFLDGDKCSQQIGHGQACTKDEECGYEFAKCLSSICTCDSDSFADNIDKACELKVAYNEVCEGIHDHECATPGADCDADSKKCLCTKGNFLDGDTCSQQVDFGAACRGIADECITPGAECDSTCKCPSTKFLKDDMCSEKVEYNDKCNGSYDNECSTINAECKVATETCLCMDGYYYDGNDCVEMLDHKEQGCTDAALQCKVIDSVCVNSACDCDSLFYHDNGICHPKFDNGENCNSETQCKIIDAKCQVTCQCETGKYNNGTMCSDKVAFQSACTTDQMCSTSSGKCIEGICDCSSNYVHDTNNDRCIIKKGYLESCVIDSECITGNSTCLSDLCQCAETKYLDAVRCVDKKLNGEDCDTTEECIVDGATCIGICTCAPNEYLNVSCTPKISLNGVCVRQEQCLYSGSDCIQGLCQCPANTYPSTTDEACMSVKAYEASCTRDEECSTNTCSMNQCACQTTHYYDTVTETCLTKIAYDGPCTASEQCDTPEAECSTEAKCQCPSDKFPSNNVCHPKLGDGESCVSADECSFKDAECVAGSCTCGTNRFVNLITSSCDEKKQNGEACATKDQCAVIGSECPGTCQCPETTYPEGSSCNMRKANGAPCLTDLECRFTEVGCYNNTCLCPPTHFEDTNLEQCIERFDYGAFCSANGQCKEGLHCFDEMCDCLDRYTYDGANCIMVTTTTAIPTTPAPDEEILIETETELTSNEPYNTDLADNTSVAYQQKKEQTEAALADQFADRTDVESVEVVGFNEGSTKIMIKIVFRKEEIYFEADIQVDTPEELEEANNIVTNLLTTVVDNALKKAAVDLEEKDIFKGVTVPDVPIVIKKKPCEDEGLAATRAASAMCAPILSYLQAVNSANERCSSYNDLLSCIALEFKMADTDCDWNLWRTNVEDFGLAVLNLNKNLLKPCVRGNYFMFKPSIFDKNPCKDLTSVKLAMTYECADSYKKLMRGNNKKCGYAREIDSCVRLALKDLYKTECSEELSVEEGYTMMIDYQDEIFDKDLKLNTCEFCVAPNIMEVWKEECSLTMEKMKYATPDVACSYLHFEMRCIEKHLTLWSESCTMDVVMEMFKSDKRFLQHGQRYLEWLSETTWNQCLENPPAIGPPEPASMCEDQVFISYLFNTVCPLNIEGHEDSCIPFYSAIECMRKNIDRKFGKDTCTYKELEKSVLGTSDDYYTISAFLSPTGELKECIITEVNSACESAVVIYAFTKGQQIVETCLNPIINTLYLPDVDQILSYNSEDLPFHCMIYAQAYYCQMSVFEWDLALCDGDEKFPEHMAGSTRSIVSATIKARLEYGIPEPTYSVDIYNTCPAITDRPLMNCLSDDVVITAFTASCGAPILGAATIDEKCSGIGYCFEGVKDWHKQHDDVCPGFVQKVEEGSEKPEFASYFFSITGFNWMACDEETIPYNVTLLFPDDPFDSEYSNIENEAAVAYIQSKSELLGFLSMGRSFQVIVLFTEDRVKRQTETAGTRMRVRFEGPANFRDIMMAQIQKVDANVLVVDFSKEGDRQGSCPVVEAYDEICEGFLDQCQSDKDCEYEGQKCCSDGTNLFCVNSTREAAVFSISFRLESEEWDDLLENVQSEQAQKLITRYRNFMSNILSEAESFSVDRFSRTGNHVNLVYSVHSFSNPNKMLREQLRTSGAEASGIKLTSVYFVSPSIEGTDRCPAHLLYGDNIITCIQERFTDGNSTFEDWQNCNTVDSLINCMSEKCWTFGLQSGCSNDLLLDQLLRDRPKILEKLRTMKIEGGVSRIISMIESYNNVSCKTMGDVDPCYDESSIEASLITCRQQLLNIPEGTFDENSCSPLYELLSCVILEMHSYGSKWCYEYNIQSEVLRFVSEQRSLTVDSSEFDETCRSPPVCTYVGLDRLSNWYCYSYPRIEYGMCSNETVMQSITAFVSCARIQAIRRGEDCSVEEIVQIIAQDRYKMRFLQQSEDIENCFSEETINSIKEELTDRDTICLSPRAVKYFYGGCFSDDCPVKLTAIEDETAKCSLLFQQSACILRNMRNQTFECDLQKDIYSTIKGMDSDMKFPLKLPDDDMEPCIERLPLMSVCEQTLLSRQNGSMECVEHLLRDVSHLEQDQKCMLYYLGGNCLKTAAVSIDAQCDDSDIFTSLRSILLGTHAGMDHLMCDYEPRPYYTYTDCDAVLPDIDLCDDSSSPALVTLIEQGCNGKLEHFVRNMTAVKNLYGIDDDLFTCSVFNNFAECGKDLLYNLKSTCPGGQLRRAIATHTDSLTNFLADKNLGKCMNVTFTITLVLKNQQFIQNYLDLEDSVTMELINELRPHLEALFTDELQWWYRIVGISQSSPPERRKRQTSSSVTLLSAEVITDSDEDPSDLVEEAINADTDLSSVFEFRAAGLSDPCIGRIRDQVKRCFGMNTVYFINDYDLGCSLYNIKVKCVRSGLETEDTCDYGLIRNQVFLELYDIDYGMSEDLWMKCNESAVVRDVCTDIEVVYRLTDICWPEFDDLSRECNDETKQKALNCYKEVILLYGDCDEDVAAEQALASLIYKSRQHYQPAVEECFSLTENDGFCPLQFMSANCRKCARDYKDRCVLDSACPDGHKCCHDGCKMACLPIATKPIKLETTILLENEYMGDYDYNLYGEQARQLISRYNSTLEGVMTLLGDAVPTVHPTVTNLWTQTDGVMITFSYDSFRDQYKTQEMIQEYFNSYGDISHQYTNNQYTEPTPKDGICPKYSFNITYDQRYCCHDYDCNDDMKCCSIGYNEKACLKPITEEVAACDDSNVLLATGQTCDIDMFTIAKDIVNYTCGQIFEKVDCILGVVNEGRPRFTECTQAVLLQTLLKGLKSLGLSQDDTDRINQCGVFHLMLTIETDNCDLETSAVLDYMARKEVVLNSLDGFTLRDEFCRQKTLKTVGRFYSEKSSYTLENEISSMFNNPSETRRKRDTFLKPNVYVSYVDINSTDWCMDNELAKDLAVRCAKDKGSFQEFQRCSPALEFFECMKNRYSSIPNLMRCELSDDRFENVVMPHLRAVLSANFSSYLDKLDYYDSQTCYDISVDKDPCYKEDNRLAAFEVCLEEHPISQFTSVSPQFCKAYYKLSTCMTVTLRQLGSKCSSYDTESFTFNQIKNSSAILREVLPTDMYRLHCEEHIPVCSVSYIMDSRYGKCGKMLTDEKTCSSDEGKLKFKQFVACLAMSALMKQETDCTVADIVGLIDSDKYKFDITSQDLDIETCFSAAEQSALSAELMPGPGLCTSGMFIEFVAHDCLLLDPWCYDNSYTLEDIPTEPACSVLITVMKCVQRNISVTIQQQCTLTDLISTELPPGSKLTTTDEVRTECQAMAGEDNCVWDGLIAKALQATFCVMTNLTTDCSMYKYPLTCLRNLLPDDCDANAMEINDGYMAFLEYREVFNTLDSCSDYPYGYRQPDPYPGCDVPDMLPDDLSCNNSQYIADFVMSSCIMHHKDMVSMAEGDDGKLCVIYNSLVDCGRARLFLINMDDRFMRCTREQVNDALLEHSDKIEEALSVNPSTCQDECFQSMSSVVAGCINATFWQLGSYGFISVWQGSCRAYSYFYQCVHQALPSCDNELKLLSMNASLPYFAKDKFRRCKDPSTQLPYDVCNNATELFEVSQYQCRVYIDPLLNTSVENQQSGMCNNQTDFRECMVNALSKFIESGSLADESMPCGDETDEIIVKATLLAVQKIFMYDPYAMHRKTPAIRACFGVENREGYCPNVKNVFTRMPSTCLIDKDCDEPTEKCCYDGHLYECRPPYTEPERYLASVRIPGLNFIELYYNFEDGETQAAVREHLEWVRGVCEQEGLTCSGFSLEPYKNYRRKRQANHTISDDSLLRFDIHALENPNQAFQRRVKEDGKNYFIEVTFYPESGGRMCPNNNGYCDDYEWTCSHDYDCRISKGAGYQCCSICGNRCTLVGNPEICDPIFDDNWDTCSMYINVEQFGSLLNYTMWTNSQCSVFESLNECLMEKDMDKECGESYFGEKIFDAIVYQLLNSSDNSSFGHGYSYPKECSQMRSGYCPMPRDGEGCNMYCSMDSDCFDDDKCCDSSCGYTHCVKPLEKEPINIFLVVLEVLNEAFMDEYRNVSLDVTKQMIERIKPMLDELFDKILEWPYQILGFYSPDRTRRQTPELINADVTYAKIEVNVPVSVDRPDRRLFEAIKDSDMLNTVFRFEYSEKQAPPDMNDCYQADVVYKNVRDKCQEQMNDLFTDDKTDEQYCYYYNQLVDCINREMSYCSIDSIADLMSYNMWTIFDNYRNDGHTELEYFSMDTRKCSKDHLCWDDSEIQRVGFAYCQEKLRMLAGRGSMSKEICGNVWELVQCVTEALHNEMSYTYTCNEVEIQARLAALVKENDNTMIDLSDLDINYCAELVCYPTGIRAVAKDDCYQAWDRFKETEDCRDLDMFVGCARFNAMGKGQDCKVEDMKNILKEIGPEMLAKEWKYHPISFCPVECYDKWDVTNDIQVTWYSSNDTYRNVEFNIYLPAGDARWAPGKWIGLGISDDQFMPNSEVIIFSWPIGGSPMMQTGYASARSRPDLDVAPHYNYSFNASSDGNRNYITLTRPRTVQDFNRQKMLNGTKYLLLSMGDIANGQISKHTEKYVSDQISMTCKQSRFDDDFPTEPSEICTYWGVNRYHARYSCHGNLNTSRLSLNDTCVLMEANIACVNERMQEFSCSLDETRMAFGDPRTTNGMYKFHRPNCSHLFSDLTHCDRHIMHSGDDMNNVCLGTIVSFLSINMVGIPANNIPAPGAQTNETLKCSLFEDVIGCYMTYKPYTGDGGVCDAASFKRMTNWNLRLYQLLAVSAWASSLETDSPLTAVDPETFVPLNFDQCPIGSQIPTYDGICPPKNIIVEHIVGRCLPQILIYSMLMQNTSYSTSCGLGAVFNACMHNPNITALQHCDAEEKSAAVDVYTDYIENISGGYNPTKCGNFQKCMEQLPQHTNCTQKFAALHLLSSHMNFTQTCALFQHYKEESRQCLIRELPDCAGHVTTYIDMAGKALYSNTSMCKGNGSLCEAVEQFGIMECGWHVLYAAKDPVRFTCNIRQCFEDLDIPDDCGLIDRQALADRAIKNTYNFTLGTCNACIHNGEVIEEGNYIFAGDACNTCTCVDGTVTCTTMYCPPRTYRIELGLREEPYNEAYADSSSPEYQALVSRTTPYLNMLFEPHGISYEFESFSRGYGRTKRQTPDVPDTMEYTVVTLSIQVSGPPMDLLREAIEKSDELRQKLVVQNVEVVEPSPCEPGYFGVAVSDTCDKSWNMYMETNDCQHYAQFVSCIRYQGFVKDVTCTIEDIHLNMQETVIRNGHDAAFCEVGTGFAQSEVEAVMPETKEEVCENWYANRHILFYYCLPDQENYMNAESMPKCLMEFAARSCVQGITYQVGCNITQTSTAFQHQSLREGLLDESVDCDATYPCLKFLTVDAGRYLLENCIQSSADLLYLDNLNNVTVYNSTEPLKCLAMEDEMSCINLYFDTDLTSCPPEEMRAAYLGLVHMRAMMNEHPQIHTIDTFESCTDLDYEIRDSCPQDEDLLNIVAISCSRYVKDTLKHGSFIEGCGTLKHCLYGIEEWYKKRELCVTEEPTIGQTLKHIRDNFDYAQYFYEITGLHWFYCPSDDNEYCEYNGMRKENGESFDAMDGCNTCTCNDGSVLCTEMACDDCEYNGMRKENGESFDAMDGCNTCTCNDGSVLCTVMACDGCFYNDRYIKNGENFEADDGCNTCGCNNGNVGCTYMSCPPREFSISISVSESYRWEYNDPSSQSYGEFINRMTPLLNTLFGNLGMEYEIEGLSLYSSGRRKRQATTSGGEIVMLHVLVKTVENPERIIREAIESDGDLREIFKLQSVEVVETDVCQTEYFGIAVKDSCAPSWNAFMNNGLCQHYVQFLSCIWYQAVVKDEVCTLGEIHDAMENITMQNGLHGRFCEEGTGFSQAEVEAVFPENKEAICENWYANRHILEYYCKPNREFIVALPLKKCLLEYAARHCVHRITSDVGCSISQTSAAFQHPSVRSNLLDETATCDTTFPCSKLLAIDASSSVLENCVSSTADLLFMNNLLNLTVFNGSEPLQCVALQNQIACVNMYHGSEIQTCDPEEIFNVHLFLTGMKVGFSERPPEYNAETYMTCGSDLDFAAEGHCPEDEEIADLITISCAKFVQETLAYGSFEYGCSALEGCYTGMIGWFKEREMCMTEEPTIEQRLMRARGNPDFARYFEMATGLNWMKCSAGESCYYDGETRMDGESFLDIDGCNTCSCMDGSVSCTEMACLQTFTVQLSLVNDVYQPEFSDIDSTISRQYIESKTPMLNLLFDEGSWKVTALYSTGRSKRQVDEGGETGVGMDVEAVGFGISQSTLTERLEDNGYSDAVQVLSTYQQRACKEEDEVECFASPCDEASCPDFPGAQCVANYCKECSARFILSNGTEVTHRCRDVDKPGFCPLVRNDIVGTCEVQCSKDSECDGEMKCCDSPCGFGHCYAPSDQNPIIAVCEGMFSNQTLQQEIVGMFFENITQDQQCDVLFNAISKVEETGPGYGYRVIMECVLKAVAKEREDIAMEGLAKCDPMIDPIPTEPSKTDERKTTEAMRKK